MVVVVILVIAFLFMSLFLALGTIYLRIRNIITARYWSRLEKKWNFAIMQIIAGELPNEAIHSLVRRSERPYFVQFLMRYEERFSGQERKTIVLMAKPYLKLIARSATNINPERRARSVQILATLGFDEYSRAIVGALRDNSPLVSMVAARSLSRSGNAEYIKHILPVMDRFENWSMNYFTSLLAGFGTDALPEIRKMYDGKTHSSRIRIACISAMRVLSDIEGIPLAQKVLRKSNDVELITATLRFIKKMGSPEQHDAVERLLDHEEFIVRANAISALGQIGSSSDEDRLVRGFEDESSWVAVHAAKALKKLDMKHVLKHIAESMHPRANLVHQMLVESE